jgi:hypothetical protein
MRNPNFKLSNFVKLHTLDMQQWKEQALLSGKDFSGFAWDDVTDWFPLEVNFPLDGTKASVLIPAVLAKMHGKRFENHKKQN